MKRNIFNVLEPWKKMLNCWFDTYICTWIYICYLRVFDFKNRMKGKFPFFFFSISLSFFLNKIISFSRFNTLYLKYEERCWELCFSASENNKIYWKILIINFFWEISNDRLQCEKKKYKINFLSSFPFIYFTALAQNINTSHNMKQHSFSCFCYVSMKFIHRIEPKKNVQFMLKWDNNQFIATFIFVLLTRKIENGIRMFRCN